MNTKNKPQAEQPAEEARGVDGDLMEAIRRYAFVFALHTQKNTDASRADADAALARIRALLAAPAAGTGQHPVIGMLIEVARCAFLALDHSEEREGPDGREHVLDAQSFDDLSDALDALDGLPDDQPGVTMGPAQKAEWALRTVAATGAQGLDIEAIAKEAWDEAWRLAFGDGVSAGHPLGRSELDRTTEWADSDVLRAIRAASKEA